MSGVRHLWSVLKLLATVVISKASRDSVTRDRSGLTITTMHIGKAQLVFCSCIRYCGNCILKTVTDRCNSRITLVTVDLLHISPSFGFQSIEKFNFLRPENLDFFSL